MTRVLPNVRQTTKGSSMNLHRNWLVAAVAVDRGGMRHDLFPKRSGLLRSPGPKVHHTSERTSDVRQLSLSEDKKTSGRELGTTTIDSAPALGAHYPTPTTPLILLTTNVSNKLGNLRPYADSNGTSNAVRQHPGYSFSNSVETKQSR